ncbi:selenium metabolism membrane protein YedE/FdhT [Helicobacter suis]|uniref:selenium metabolism membrane protein YedE/FdhT n=1 Tax=Helicobacter suis TaxID=104628 RepID=UPI0013D10D19|nr:selenium metabolism membrane protein YedE/FdhT [Helicobacter suis]
MYSFLTRKWGFVPSCLALGVGSVYYFGLLGTYWAVTGEFTRWGGALLQALHVNTNHLGYFKIIGLHGNFLERIDGVMILGMFIGMFCAASLSGSICLSWPKIKELGRAFLGGILAGLGARLGLGCNLASFLTGIPQFSLHAWFFTLATLLGMYLAFKCFPTTCFIPPKGKSIPLKISQFLGLFALVGFMGLLLCGYFSSKLAYALFFGYVFGFIVSKGQICFTAAFARLFTRGQGLEASALVWAMLVGSIGVMTYIRLGVMPKIMWASPGIVVGGLLFGFGIVMAGGCECGWMYRTMQGEGRALFIGLGNIVGASLVALSWDFYAPLFTSFPKINLLDMGNLGLVLQVILLFVLYFIIQRVARRVRSRI